MRKVRIKSVIPIYAVALAWILWGLLFPLYKWWHFLLAAVISFLFNRTAALIWKGDEIYMPEPEPEPEKTGNPELDKFIADGKNAISEFSRLGQNIRDEKIKKCIETLITVSGKIFTHIKENPRKLGKVRRFMNYYLPTTLKLLNTYDRMGAQGINGENIDSTMIKIENMADTVISAFEKQLDALFADEFLDISTDITVLENLLEAEGLSESNGNLKKE